ncbi:hypothetical protein [Methylobacterium aerolatum]|uniref:Uncharacterized protein n=1 Tax=Methylobacterium aerolatum TaxID=418708 RepID=A0ABU0HYV3_9HYPH|nr:hypothetical protein [Methylobacterium aerolatum]MDQ0446669.1 hypothetical protein [Methylobacterium aerolatum]GJD33636.1 hypothetical protein FMGBMHLM_0528 [Methylobacterium aerolatum]
MPTGRSIRLPVDPWPRASLGERAAVGSVLTLLLALPCVAAGILGLLALVLTQHVMRSYDCGTAIRAMIDRR